ncbi:MAG: ABC transporter ATP-binding protein, partial [Lachnospiraceae bacterium]|nr:ABC transporter ATP-binding protein [Lachnospiraceae bacterium]
MPRQPIGVRPKTEKSMGELLTRIFRVLLEEYKVHLIAVVVCILGSALASLRGTLFIRSLIDDYITPLLGMDNPDFSGLLTALISVAFVYLLGVACSFTYNRLMIYVTQGTLRNMRIKLFDNMESLPIKYFDTHAHGDIMSVYTNDIDTLRQLISQALPQILNSSITIVGTVVSMIVLSLPLTGVALVMVCVMVCAVRALTKRSGMYFTRQQKALGVLNGYIE